jgi:hypothetical protein
VSPEPFFVTNRGDVLFFDSLESCDAGQDWCYPHERYGPMHRVRLDGRMPVTERNVDLVHERMSATFHDFFQIISPDGGFLLYQTYDSRELRLTWMEDLATSTVASYAERPRISPDGSRVGWLDEDRRVVVWEPAGDGDPVTTLVAQKFLMFELDWGFLEGSEWVYLATDFGPLVSVARVDAEHEVYLPGHDAFVAPPWKDQLILGKRVGEDESNLYDLVVLDLITGGETPIGRFSSPFVPAFLDDLSMTIWVEAPNSEQDSRIGSLHRFDPVIRATTLLAANIGYFHEFARENQVLLHMPSRQSYRCGISKTTGSLQALDPQEHKILWSRENVAHSALKEYGLTSRHVLTGWVRTQESLAVVVDPCGLDDFVAGGAWLPGVWFMPLR